MTMEIPPNTLEPTAPQVWNGEIEPPGGRENTPEGHVQEVADHQNENKDGDGKITDQARELRRLDVCQQEIQMLQ